MILLAISMLKYTSGSREADKKIPSVRDYWNSILTPHIASSRWKGITSPFVATTPKTTPSTTQAQRISPHSVLQKIILKTAGPCGLREGSYLPHLPIDRGTKPRKRRGRIVWEDQNTMGSKPAPQGTFPWLVSLFVLLRTGEALFMCAGSIIGPNLIVTAAHCFTNNAQEETWFARVGDNFILANDPDEQTFRVKKIIQHEQFDPLKETGGDGRNDIALVVLQAKRNSRYIKFGPFIRPVCVPPQDYPISKLYPKHCEIHGWGMTEYNNTKSYPDSIRAARITVGDVPDSYCNYLYGRNVGITGKFCAGGAVDACQEDSGGPIMCTLDGFEYTIMGIVSSGKGCGVYPGLYTDVSRYIDWLAYWVTKEIDI